MNRLKKLLFFAFCAYFMLGGVAFAGHAHYVNGIEGIKAATAPPPGTYWKMYTLNYTGVQRNNSGDRNTPRVTADVFGVVNRFIHVSETQFLGGNILMEVIVPLANTQIHVRGTPYGSAGHDEHFGLGDIIVGPLILAWHGERWDAIAGVDLFLPTGRFDNDCLASPGRGYFTVMPTFGGTVYLDKEKTWSVSALGRYEFNTKQDHTRTKPGQDFHFEWGIGKSYGVWEAGIAGYCSWQTTKDTGPNAGDLRERVYAVGPEVSYAVPDWGTIFTLRSVWEFEARNTTQGNLTSLTITKAF